MIPEERARNEGAEDVRHSEDQQDHGKRIGSQGEIQLQKGSQVCEENMVSAETQDVPADTRQNPCAPEQGGHVPETAARAGRERGQGAVLPDEPESGHERAEEKDISPADQMADPARHGQGDDRRYGNPGVDDAQGAGDVLRGDELQGDGGGQRPEAAHADAEYRTPDEHDRIGRSHADQHVGRDKHGGKSQQDAPPVGVSRQRGQQEAGQHGEHAYGGDRLPGHALGDGKISGNGRQQAYGDEFGCNQGHDAHK